MDSTLIGEPQRFAIEYELEAAWPPYGRVRLWLWLDGLCLGDIRRSMFLYHMASSLRAVATRDPAAVRCLFTRACDVPAEYESLSGVSWSWGDSFDDFLFVLYAVEEEGCVTFRWALHQSRAGDFPGYPPGPHVARVSCGVFDAAVAQFVGRLAIP